MIQKKFNSSIDITFQIMASSFVPPVQNFYATIVDTEPQMDLQQVASGQIQHYGKTPKPPRASKVKRQRPDPATFGPTNKQQFEQIANYLNHLNEKITQLEQENNNLKSIISLADLKPLYDFQSVENSQLPQLYNEKLKVFTQCMK